MGKDPWVAGADRGEAPGPKPVRLGRRLRLRLSLVQQVGCVAKTHREVERCVIASSTHSTSSYSCSKSGASRKKRTESRAVRHRKLDTPYQLVLVQQVGCVAKTHREVERCVIASSTHPTSSYVMRLRLGRAVLSVVKIGPLEGSSQPPDDQVAFKVEHTMSIMSACRTMNWTPRLPRRWARLSIGLVLVALATYALEYLPYSTSLIEHVESTDVESQRPDPDFNLGSLRWEVSRYAVDPRLEPLRNYYRILARLREERPGGRSTHHRGDRLPLPAGESVPGVCGHRLRPGRLVPPPARRRTGSLRDAFRFGRRGAAGVRDPARVFQIIPLDPDGRLGATVTMFWKSGTSGAAGRWWTQCSAACWPAICLGRHPRAESCTILVLSRYFLTITILITRKANHTIINWDQGFVCSSRSRGCTSVREIVGEIALPAVASCASGWVTGNSAQRRTLWLVSSVYR